MLLHFKVSPFLHTLTSLHGVSVALIILTRSYVASSSLAGLSATHMQLLPHQSSMNHGSACFISLHWVLPRWNLWPFYFQSSLRGPCNLSSLMFITHYTAILHYTIIPSISFMSLCGLQRWIEAMGSSNGNNIIVKTYLNHLFLSIKNPANSPFTDDLYDTLYSCLIHHQTMTLLPHPVSPLICCVLSSLLSTAHLHKNLTTHGPQFLPFLIFVLPWSSILTPISVLNSAPCGSPS